MKHNDDRLTARYLWLYPFINDESGRDGVKRNDREEVSDERRDYLRDVLRQSGHSASLVPYQVSDFPIDTRLRRELETRFGDHRLCHMEVMVPNTWSLHVLLVFGVSLLNNKTNVQTHVLTLPLVAGETLGQFAERAITLLGPVFTFVRDCTQPGTSPT